MGARWNPLGFRLLSLSALIYFCFRIPGSLSVNDEGMALLAFKDNIKFDPFGALENWSPERDGDPCQWNGVHCADDKVHMLNLTDLSLEGTLAPALGKFSHLKSLVLCKNRLSGEIPKEIWGLARLELLDLRNNDLSGTIPVEIGRMCSLKQLLLGDNRFEGDIPILLKGLNLLSDLVIVSDHDTSTGVARFGSVNRKFRHFIWQSDFNYWNNVNSFTVLVKGTLTHYLNYLRMPRVATVQDTLNVLGDSSCENLSNALQSHMMFARRRLQEEATFLNVPALPFGGPEPSIQVITIQNGRSSGSFPAVPDSSKRHSPPPVRSPPASPPSPSSENNQLKESPKSSSNGWKYIVTVVSVAVLLIVLGIMVCLCCRSKAVTTIKPWKTGISGQLQKAFVTGVPNLNRAELVAACEEFSNIISTVDGAIMYKGTLSSGVEIAVASTTLTSSKDWSKNAEKAYRRKVDALSRVNHKNFVNLIGYCEDNEHFARMMVFEYAPNGSLYEHLHVEAMEHLDWTARVRIIMGIAYCLEYMHHDLIPPVSHPNLVSSSIYLTDDYAAKIAELCFWGTLPKSKKDSDEDDKEHLELPPISDPEANVYSFGQLLIETVSGKRQTTEVGCLAAWASAYLNEHRSNLVDPSLKSYKHDELDIICEVIKECTKQDPRKRPTMRDVTEKLRQVILITPNQAVPRLSPLWWAELEILSVEAT